MKKLNRKGFTLIELLAIIVILAIIMVVTFPNILDAISTSRAKTFVNSANSIADWVEEQYSFATLGQLKSTDPFVVVCEGPNYCSSGTTLNPQEDITDGPTKGESVAFLKAAGVVADNYSEVSISFAGGRACVTVKSNATGGDFSGIGADAALGITVDETTKIATAKSNGC